MKYLGFYTGVNLYRIGWAEPIILNNSFVYYEATYPGSDNIRIYPLIGHNDWKRYEFTTPDKIDTVGRQLAKGYKIFLRNPYVFDGKECVVEEIEIEAKGEVNEAIERPTYLKLRQMYMSHYMSFEDYDRILGVLDRSRHIRFDAKMKLNSRSTMPPTSFFNELTADPIPNTIKEELKKSLEQDAMKSALNSCYGMGGFTTRTISLEEIQEMFDNIHSKNKETKTMEKKMTDTDKFLKSLNDITITSTYTRLKYGFADPYYIYYPKMEITEDIADTLLTVLLMAYRDYIHKVIFNPEKGTTTIFRSSDCSTTVRCKDAEFDYILGYEMARSKRHLGSDDYNWFNKIMNHRKTHVQYTEKKTKKGGKKS